MDDVPRVVFDTGVFLQAAIRPAGPAAAALSLADTGSITLCISEAGLGELTDVLHRPRIRARNPLLTEAQVEAVLARIRRLGTMILTVPELYHCARDPDDEPVINLALAAAASYLVSRDRDLLDLMDDTAFRERFPWLLVMDPVSFLRRL